MSGTSMLSFIIRSLVVSCRAWGVPSMVQGLGAWEIVGIFLAMVLVVALIIFGIVLLVRKASGKHS